MVSFVRAAWRGSGEEGNGKGTTDKHRRTLIRAKDLTQRVQRNTREKSEKDNGTYGRDAECAENCEGESGTRLTLWQVGAQPFDPVLRDLTMNRPAGRFTSSARTAGLVCSAAWDFLKGGRPRLGRRGLGLWGFCRKLRACADRLRLRRYLRLGPRRRGSRRGRSGCRRGCGLRLAFL